MQHIEAEPQPVVALSPDKAAVAADVSRTRIFEVIRAGDLTARRAGKSTIIEIDELRRWIRALPVRRPSGRQL
jgi:hypothetical protein